MINSVVRCSLAAIVACVLSFSNLTPAQAQWKYLGPYGGEVFSLAVDGDVLIAGTYGSGVFSSRNGGTDWKKVSTNDFTSEVIDALAVFNGKWFAATLSGLLISTDQGESWNGKQNSSAIYTIYPTDGKIFVGNNKGVYVSSDEGVVWKPSNSGIESEAVLALIKSGGRFIAGTENGFYVSTDGGSTWESQIALISDPYIHTLEASGTYILAGTPAGVVRSSDNGVNWESANSGAMTDESNVYDLTALSDGRLVASTPSGFLLTTDAGTTWTNMGLNEEYGYTMMQQGSNLIAGTNIGASVSSNNGTTWTPINAGITGIGTASIAVLKNNNGQDVLYTGGQDLLFSSQSKGDKWESITRGAPLGFVNELAKSGTDLYVVGAGGPGGGVFRSTDDGATWENKSAGIFTDKLWNITAIGSDLFVGTYQVGLFHSSDRGENWEIVPEGPVGVSVTNTLAIDNTLIASSYTGLFRSRDKGLTWTSIADGLGSTNVFDITYDGSRLYAGTYGAGVNVSTDMGTTWESYDNSLSQSQISAMTYVDNKVFALTGQGVYVSVDQGKTWQDGSLGLNVANYRFMLTADATTMYMATDGGVWSRPLSEFGSSAVSAELQTADELSVSPNPAQLSLTLSNIPMNATQIIVLNVTGQEVLRVGNTGSSTRSIDISALATGCYVVKVLSPSGAITSQFIKQ